MEMKNMNLFTRKDGIQCINLYVGTVVKNFKQDIKTGNIARKNVLAMQ